MEKILKGYSSTHSKIFEFVAKHVAPRMLRKATYMSWFICIRKLRSVSRQLNALILANSVQTNG